LTRALYAAIRCLFWFHPLAWWLCHRAQILAEMACDAAVVERRSNPTAYCRILLEFASAMSATGYRTSLSSLAMTGAGGLDQRIDRIYAASRGGLRRLTRPGRILVLAGAPALCLAASVDLTTAPFRLLFFFQGQHVGKLKPDLVPTGTRRQTEPLKPATPEERTALPVMLVPGDALFTGTTFADTKQKLRLALIEPASGGDPYIFADVNRNGAFEANERFTFGGPERTVLLRIPMSTGQFRTYPIKLWLPEEKFYRDEDSNKDGRTLMRSSFIFVEGAVDVGGRPILARYLFDADKHNAYPDYGWIGMDTNGDGRIDENANDDEFTFAKDEGVIFHVNGHDVSTVSIDLKAGTFVIRDHPAGINPRIPLRVGEQVPDFRFTDLDGKAHQFEEFKGKYVLLEFWGTWCGPCRSELPNLEKAYQQFRGRQFVVLGMDDDRDVAKVRALLQEKGVTFPQSTGDMGNELVYKRFRVNRFPTAVLIDPAGKIISLDLQGQFRGENLSKTLDRILPPAHGR
jgi:thiol-disulfide isomerase/thioredoxin